MINFKRKYVKFLIAIIFFVFTIILNNGKCQAAEVKKTNVTIVYFYMSVCAQCKDAEKYLAQIDTIAKSTGYPVKPVIRMYNLFEEQNYHLLDKYFEQYKVPLSEQSTPVIFIGENFYTGQDAIKEGVIKNFSKGQVINTNIIQLTPLSNVVKDERFEKMKAVNVFALGLINGFNPCSLSMLLFFLSMLVTKKVSIKSMGFLFGLGKFITYLLLGTVLFRFFSSIQMNAYLVVVKVIMGIFVIFIVYLNIKDWYATRQENYSKVKNQLPKFLRRYNHNIIKKFTDKNKIILLFSFLLGIIISVGEFMCTGQIYLASIVYMLRSNTVLNLRAFTYLVIYDFAFIIPLIIITLLIDKGKELFDVSEVLRKWLPVIKLINAAVFIVIGFVVIFVY